MSCGVFLSSSFGGAGAGAGQGTLHPIENQFPLEFLNQIWHVYWSMYMLQISALKWSLFS